MDDKNQDQEQPDQNQFSENQPSPSSDFDTQDQNQTTIPDEYEPPTRPIEGAAPNDPWASPSANPSTDQFQSEFRAASEQEALPPKKSKTKLIIAIILGAILVLLFAGSALAYKLWFQNPDKVVADSIANIIKAETVTGNGDVKFDNKEASIDIKIDHANTREAGHADISTLIKIKKYNLDLDVKGEGTYTKEGDIYFKLKDLDTTYKKVVDAYMQVLIEQYKSYGTTLTPAQQKSATDTLDKQVGPIIQKLDDQWIKISADDLKDVNKQAGDTQDCVAKALNMLRDDKQTRDEVVKLYHNNKFIVIKDELGSRNGSLGYKIDYDEAASKSFGDGLEQTAFGKQIKACDDTSNNQNNSSQNNNEDNFKDTNAEVWVDRWSHELTSVSFSGATTGNDSGTFSLNYQPKFNEQVTVEAPKDAMTLKQLEQELQLMAPASNPVGLL